MPGHLLVARSCHRLLPGAPNCGIVPSKLLTQPKFLLPKLRAALWPKAADTQTSLGLAHLLMFVVAQSWTRDKSVI